MKTINDPGAIRQWGYYDAQLGKGFSGTRDHIIVQVQQAYVAAGIEFRDQQIPAQVDDYMCEQGFATNCTDRIEGLGDIVHYVAQPIAKLSDALFGTKFVGCGGCAARRQAMNEAVPL